MRRLANVAAVTSLIAGTAVCWRRRVVSCENEQKASAPPHRVLIIGGGLTGSLTAALIRRRWPAGASEQPLDLHVWERASYAAGRFGATAAHGKAVADLGAQVLSTVDPDDERVRAGHGITKHVSRLAMAEVQSMMDAGILIEACSETLCATEERLNWEGLWRHFWAARGMCSVLETLLTESKANILFGVRCDSVRDVCINGRTKLMVRGSGPAAPDRWLPEYQKEKTPEQIVASHQVDVFDAVVVCTPTWSALDISGVAECLDADALAVLRGVEYDARTVHAVFFDSVMTAKLQALFITDTGRAAEISFDPQITGDPAGSLGIDFISWQGAKRGTDSAACIVAHCFARPHNTHSNADGISNVYQALARHLGTDPQHVKSMVLHTKTVDWTRSQMRKPMEALVPEPPEPPWTCLEATRGGANLVVAGDFMTQSSFLGCYASADAAARAILAANHKES